MARKSVESPFKLTVGQAGLIRSEELRILEHPALANNAIICPGGQMSTDSYQGTPSRRAGSVTESFRLQPLPEPSPICRSELRPHTAPEGAKNQRSLRHGFKPYPDTNLRGEYWRFPALGLPTIQISTAWPSCHIPSSFCSLLEIRIRARLPGRLGTEKTPASAAACAQPIRN
jgi:hypothetical protein